MLPAAAVPRALVNHDAAGVTKLVAATGVLLGASVVGDGAGDVIQSAVLAIRHRLTAAEHTSAQCKAPWPARQGPDRAFRRGVFGGASPCRVGGQDAVAEAAGPGRRAELPQARA